MVTFYVVSFTDAEGVNHQCGAAIEAHSSAHALDAYLAMTEQDDDGRGYEVTELTARISGV
jgi:hypothetical protein